MIFPEYFSARASAKSRDDAHDEFFTRGVYAMSIIIYTRHIEEIRNNCMHHNVEQYFINLNTYCRKLLEQHHLPTAAYN